MSTLRQRLHGAIAAGIRQAVTDERTAINYHERRASPDLNWVYGQANGIADYIGSSQVWHELAAVEALIEAHSHEYDALLVGMSDPT